MNKRVQTIWNWQDIRDLAYDLYGQILDESTCKEIVKKINNLRAINKTDTAYYIVNRYCLLYSIWHFKNFLKGKQNVVRGRRVRLVSPVTGVQLPPTPN